MRTKREGISQLTDMNIAAWQAVWNHTKICVVPPYQLRLALVYDSLCSPVKTCMLGERGLGWKILLLDRYVPWRRWITVEAHKRRWEKERLRLLQRNAWRRSADLWTLGNRRLFLWIKSHHCLMPPIHQDNPRPRKLERRDTEGGRKEKKSVSLHPKPPGVMATCGCDHDGVLSRHYTLPLPDQSGKRESTRGPWGWWWPFYCFYKVVEIIRDSVRSFFWNLGSDAGLVAGGRRLNVGESLLRTSLVHWGARARHGTTGQQEAREFIWLTDRLIELDVLLNLKKKIFAQYTIASNLKKKTVVTFLELYTKN